MISVVERVLFLRGIDLFAALSGEDLAEVAHLAEEVAAARGQRRRAYFVRGTRPMR